MTMEIRVPTLGESVTEATVAKWLKAEGDRVSADEPLVELETDKVAVEVPAPAAGVLSSITVKPGQTVSVGAVLGAISEGNGATTKAAHAAKAGEPTKPAAKAESVKPVSKADASTKTPESKPASPKAEPAKGQQIVMPAAQKLAAETGVDTSGLEGTGRAGRVLKGDVLNALEARVQPVEAKAPTPSGPRSRADREERVPMTQLRRTIAARLKAAQNTAAMLTTFNEVDMSSVMALRAQYKDAFEKRHDVKLGFMGFFVRACMQALKEVPAVNAEIDGTDIVYKNYYDIGVAVGTERGLVVPVIRDADTLSLAGIEKTIHDFGVRARDAKLKLEELQGGTFTISNGGVYGSLMSTPILNAPQSGVLGMHKIEERPIALKGQVAIRPMMYLALSYDHRIVDGREAVTFLVRVKENLEGPERLLLDL